MLVVMGSIIGAMVMVIIGYILGLRAGAPETDDRIYRLLRERRRLKAEIWNIKTNAAACIDEFASDEGKKWWKQWCENRIKVNREEDED